MNKRVNIVALVKDGFVRHGGGLPYSQKVMVGANGLDLGDGYRQVFINEDELTKGAKEPPFGGFEPNPSHVREVIEGLDDQLHLLTNEELAAVWEEAKNRYNADLNYATPPFRMMLCFRRQESADRGVQWVAKLGYGIPREVPDRDNPSKIKVLNGGIPIFLKTGAPDSNITDIARVWVMVTVWIRLPHQGMGVAVPVTDTSILNKVRGDLASQRDACVAYNEAHKNDEPVRRQPRRAEPRRAEPPTDF